MNVADDTRTVGQRLRQIRHDRASRWPGCEVAATTPRWHCAAPSESPRTTCITTMPRAKRFGELVARAKQDAVGRELRGMAYRAGLPV